MCLFNIFNVLMFFFLFFLLLPLRVYPPPSPSPTRRQFVHGVVGNVAPNGGPPFRMFVHAAVRQPLPKRDQPTTRELHRTIPSLQRETKATHDQRDRLVETQPHRGGNPAPATVGRPDGAGKLSRFFLNYRYFKRFLTVQYPNTPRFISVPAQLGIEGNVLPDGRFQTANGDIIGMTSADAEAVAGDGKVNEWW